MKTKKNKTLWIVLGIIVIVIAALSISTCINSSVSVDTSEFNSLYQTIAIEDDEGNCDAKLTKAEVAKLNAPTIKDELKNISYETVVLKNVVFDSYVVEFELAVINGSGRSETIAFTANYSRASDQIALIEAALDKAGVNYSYTDPNAGSIWSSLLPLVGCVVIAIVFFIIMMQTQGGTKRYFTPEFLGRLDGIVAFSPLDRAAMEAIARKYLEQLQKRAEAAGYSLQYSEDFSGWLVAQCRGKGGARQLRRVIQNKLEAPLSVYLLKQSKRCGKVILCLDGDNVRFQL